MDNFRTDVIHPEEARILSGKRDYKAENAKVNDLGWSDQQRRKAIEEIVERGGLTGASARAIEVQTDTYLKARVEIGRTLDRKPNRTDAEASPGRAEGDAESDAYARSVAKLNSWRDEAPASVPAQAHRAPTAPAPGDAAEQDEAYARSVANLNSWRDRA